MFRNNYLTLSAIVGILMLTLSGTAQSDIPKVVSYQGRVTDAGGTPVADGSYAMRFWIYDAVTGGSSLWDSGAQPVNVSGGVFSVLLGESPQPMINLDFDQDYWLLVRFNGVDQTPRQRLAAIGYAYMASGLVAGTEVIGSVIGVIGSAIKAKNTATTGYAYGLWGESASSNRGYGVYGSSTAATGYAYGVYGVSLSESGYGLYGITYATTGSTRGVYGHVYSTAGYGVYGHASALTGNTRAVFGQCHSNDGMGVYGYAISPAGYTYGVYGRSDSPSRGHGVYGEATATTGYTYGVYGTSYSTDGRAVYGHATAGAGYTVGVFGASDSEEGNGVEGRANASTGVVKGVSGAAWSPSGYGVHGYHGSGGYGVYSSGTLGASGSKSCVVKTSQGPTLLYCQESPENWFEDFGEDRLADGRAHIELDPLFLETVTIDTANPMKVFVELGGKCEGVYVEKGLTGFDVIELHDGRSSVAFDYRVVAKRKGFEEKRLDYCKAAETDSYLYPELREKELREHEEEKRDRMERERVQIEEQRARTESERTHAIE